MCEKWKKRLSISGFPFYIHVQYKCYQVSCCAYQFWISFAFFAIHSLSKISTRHWITFDKFPTVQIFNISTTRIVGQYWSGLAIFFGQRFYEKFIKKKKIHDVYTCHRIKNPRILNAYKYRNNFFHCIYISN